MEVKFSSIALLKECDLSDRGNIIIFTPKEAVVVKRSTFEVPEE